MPDVWRLGTIELGLDRPRLMAIVNASPDSFHAGSVLASELPDLIRPALELLLAQGPDIVDIGGQSTRPGSSPVPPSEELRRTIPVIVELRKLDREIPVTVDTYSAEVASEALAAGADGINDIGAGRLDPDLWAVVAASGAGYVLMHMQGTPATMQQTPYYTNCQAEVIRFLGQKLAELEAAGISPEQVVLDPGIGFGKRLADNLELLSAARAIQSLGRPALYGVSRKRWIHNICTAAGWPELAQEPAQRLSGTLAATWHLLSQGVRLHRVHDVAAVRQLFAVWEAVNQAELCPEQNADCGSLEITGP